MFDHVDFHQTKHRGKIMQQANILISVPNFHSHLNAISKFRPINNLGVQFFNANRFFLLQNLMLVYAQSY